jgi:hypothetical protein
MLLSAIASRSASKRLDRTPTRNLSETTRVAERVAE